MSTDIQTKTCRICQREQTLDRYCKASGGKYLRSECRDCERDLSKIRNTIKKTAPPVPENHICPICNKNEEMVRGRGGKKSGTWCCDHDHSTNVFRGWLCHQCNRALGNFNDDVEKLNRAIDYLQR